MTPEQDWDYIWEHWRELSEEERAAISKEIHAESQAAFMAFGVAAREAAKAVLEFEEACRG